MDMPDIIANQIKTKHNKTCPYLMEYILHVQHFLQMITSWQIRFPFYGIEVQIMGSCWRSYEVVFYLHNIANLRAHESTRNWYHNYNKTMLSKVICIFYGMYCVCSNDSIRSQWPLLQTCCRPFDASNLTKPFMILVSRAYRPAIMAWAIIPEPYHLVTYLQVAWN